MKHQEVSVDYWSMLKTMFTYVVLAAMCWIMLRLCQAVFLLPRRLRSQQDSIENTLKDLQDRFPGLDITEEDLIRAEKDFEDIMKETEEKTENSTKNSFQKYKIPEIVEPTEESEETEEIEETEESKKDN